MHTPFPMFTRSSRYMPIRSTLLSSPPDIKSSQSVLLTPGIIIHCWKVSDINLLPVPQETGFVWVKIMFLDDLYSIMHLEVEDKYVIKSVESEGGRV